MDKVARTELAGLTKLVLDRTWDYASFTLDEIWMEDVIYLYLFSLIAIIASRLMQSPVAQQQLA